MKKKHKKHLKKKITKFHFFRIIKTNLRKQGR